MSVARTARRVRKQMKQNNSHISGMGVSRYSLPQMEKIYKRAIGKATKK